ncbi:LamG-like jellyroll fold domain-containing protein [Kitasatospora sp. NPDC008050]|uniref:LamG-like jellyroll fold domain-containing protein n=1 Tax=Kitasatospora sp. NPDC008050 TaxID=3364021 RepID=UPI0036E7A991
MQNDRNLVLYSSTGAALWNSNTYQQAAPGIPSNGSYSVSAWVKLTGGTGADQSAVCQQGNSVPSVNLQYRDATHSWAVMTTSQDSGNAGWIYTGSAGWSGYTGAWTHITATHSADNQILTFSLNGYPVSSTPMTSPWVANRETTIGGCYANNDHSKIINQLNGEVSDVRSYPFQLTSQQVAGLYNVPRQQISSNISGSNKCVDNSQANTSDGNRIQIFGCNGSTTAGTQLQLYVRNKSAAQSWTIK